MFPIEKSLDEISRIAKIKENENTRFRIFLKGLNSKRVDNIVHRINDEVVEQIKCTECGNCCTCLRPTVTNKEVVRLSEITNLSKVSFTEKYLEKDDFENTRFLKDKPCIFLENKKCTIYKDRPADCKSFPHIDKNGFIGRTMSMLNNYEICPIVFNVMERLKRELKFR